MGFRKNVLGTMWGKQQIPLYPLLLHCSHLLPDRPVDIG
jgi:hypothetical protein